MTAAVVSEQTVEDAVMAWLHDLGYGTAFGPDISPGGSHPERRAFNEVLLVGRLKAALKRINSYLPGEAIEEAVAKIQHLGAATLEENNRRFHQMLRDGVPVEVTQSDGEQRGEIASLFDFDKSENNDWLAVNQFTVVVGEYHRRADVAAFVNGLPLAVVELKNPAEEQATVRDAFQQLENYRDEIPELFHYNEILVVSDGTEARHGTITSEWERFAPWRWIENQVEPPEDMPLLEVLLQGIFEKSRFLDLVRNFVVFESDGSRLFKKMAMYHQYHGVNAAVRETLRAAGPDGDRRVGVLWHTQGSGKSLSMVFYTAKVMRQPALRNPTVLVLTDRNDLDNQIHDNFCRAKDLVPYPKQAETVEHLKELLQTPAGGVLFSTVQKFDPQGKPDFPLLSERDNVIVIADEAHRSHYNFLTGFARHIRQALPNASFVGFTGTPVELEDRSTRQVFGKDISVYDIERSIDDHATVPIYYESRLAKMHLSNEFIDEDFDLITEGEEELVKERLKARWARLEAMVGAPDRLARIAKDLVAHYTERARTLKGKALVVCMSRRICVAMYKAMTSLEGCPEVAVVMTGSASDPRDFQPHIRNKRAREEIKGRFVDADNPLRIVIVRDMWLTGFDNPCLHTMYVDKPMKGHTLMQAIARVNRVFRDKPGGLIVDYIGIADQLRRALGMYTQKQREEAMIPIDQAVALMMEKYEVVGAFFHGIDYAGWKDLRPEEKMKLFRKAQNAVVKDEETKRRFVKACTELSKAFSLVVPHPKAMKIRDDVMFFQAVRKSVVKYTPPAGMPPEQLDVAVRQLISEAVAAEEVVDIFGLAGEQKPDISILSDEFLEKIQQIEYQNLRLQLLMKLLEDQIQVQYRRNVVRYRSLKEMLEKLMKAYENRTIQAAEIIKKLVELARQLRQENENWESLGLSEEEKAFYDVVAQGKKKIEDDEEVRQIARALVKSIKSDLSIDWSHQESVKARIRAKVKRLLRRLSYSPTEVVDIVPTIMEQAESLYRDWPAAA
jgi:type I restriction enzyme R subunit